MISKLRPGATAWIPLFDARLLTQDKKKWCVTGHALSFGMCAMQVSAAITFPFVMR
jgi:hypothetical protein